MVSVQRIVPTQFDKDLSDVKLTNDYPVATFNYPDCAKKLLLHVGRIWHQEKENFKNGILLIAHNAGYDLRFLFNAFDADFQPTLIRGSLGSLKQFNARFTYDPTQKSKQNKRKRSAGKPGAIKPGAVFVRVKDSLNFTMCPLSEFPRMFDLGSIEKEIMPYEAYTEERIFSEYEVAHSCLIFSEFSNSKYLEEDDLLSILRKRVSNNPKHKYAQRTGYQGCTEEDVTKFETSCIDKFKANIRNWNCLFTDSGVTYVDLIKYSKVYCERDVEILAKGYAKLRHMFHTVAGGINIDDCVSVNSLTNRALQEAGCTEGVHELAGIPRDFIQHCVTGGKCMLRNNRKQMLDGKGKLADFDAVSLYPSAMAEMPGLLKGIPHVIPEDMTLEDLNEITECGKQGAWFARVRIDSIGREWQMPICNYLDDGKRMFTNDMVGREMWCSSVTAEDMIQFQDITFTILQGYYFNQGYNTKLKEFITNIFEERLKMKKVNNPMQLVYKLMMNGCYGRLILKPIEFENRFVLRGQDGETFYRLLKRDWNQIKEFTELDAECPWSHYVQMYKEIHRHWSAPHLGTMILDHSKRIMNRLHAIAHAQEIPIFYMDTDSMHFFDKHVALMAREYKQHFPHINDGELIGKKLGQFHNDFDLEPIGPVELLNIDKKKIRSKSFVAYGKKCYLHKVIASNTSSGDEVESYSFAMKGFTEASIYDVCNHEGITVPELYRNVYNGNSYKADLLAGNRVSFQYDKSMQVASRDHMTRTIRSLS